MKGRFTSFLTVQVLRTRDSWRELRRWFNEVTILYRWKVAISVVTAMITVVALVYKTDRLNEARIHDVQCAAAMITVKVKDAMYRITDLRAVFPDGDQAVVDLYTDSMHAIIAEIDVPKVDDCPRLI